MINDQTVMSLSLLSLVEREVQRFQHLKVCLRDGGEAKESHRHVINGTQQICISYHVYIYIYT